MCEEGSYLEFGIIIFLLSFRPPSPESRNVRGSLFLGSQIFQPTPPFSGERDGPTVIKIGWETIDSAW